MSGTSWVVSTLAKTVRATVAATDTFRCIPLGAGTASDQVTALAIATYVATTLATVASSGAYSDLSGKPSLGSLAALNTASLTANVSGTLPTANGGTGLTTLTFPSVTDTVAVLGTPQTFTGTKTIFSSAPTATVNYGLLSLGSGPFDGSTTGKFVGSSNGTLLAGNAASGFAGNLFDFQVAGTSFGKLTAAGALTVSYFTVASGTMYLASSSGTLAVSGSQIQFGDGANTSGFSLRGAAGAAVLATDAANTLALRNATNAQQANFYNTFTSSTSYERLAIDWVTTTNTAAIDVQKGSGAGTQRPLSLRIGGTEVVGLTAAGILKYTANNSTGSGSALLGTNCPAVTVTAPYTWVTVISNDGSTCYQPLWK